MNASLEFIRHTHGREVDCAILWYGYDWVDEPSKTAVLKQGFTAQDLEDFLSKLDFDYDSGYGSQYINGFIWYLDGTWSDRGEYDGSEWWVHRRRPIRPEEVLNEQTNGDNQ